MGASARTSAPPVSGPRLPERYELRRHIASGGMASVWCAEDRVLGRSVAVKVLAERYADDQLAVRRFTREARAAARVSAHPHVVTIFDVGDLEPDDEADEPSPGRSSGPAGASAAHAFIVMEYLSGGTVADAIRVGAVQQSEAVRWLGEAASALDHAHERGIVHRDIKPANFLLDNRRVLHVADFGIARLQSEDTITSSGELFGTAAYLAPEQALGREATSATDRYSLAVTAFELLAGKRPFTSTHFAAQARQHVEDEPPRASERNRALAPAVDAVLIRGMAKDPEARYETAGAFVAAVQGALQGAPATAQTRTLRTSRPLLAPVPSARAAGGARPPARVIPAAAGQPVRRPRTTRTRPPSTGRGVGVPAMAPAPERRSGRMIALAALAVAILGVALVALLGQAGSPSHHTAASTAAKRTHASRRHRTSRATAAPATSAGSSTTAAGGTAASSSTASTATAPTSAAALQAQGHQDLASGDYAAAIAADHRALAAANPTDLTYAYALYDLGVALMRSGDPKAAIPVLEQRLKIPDQTGVVQQTLDQARQQAGLAPASAPAPTPPTPGAGHGHDQASGGAGLPPGQAKKHGGD